MSYELHVNASTTGVASLDQAVGSTDKLVGSTSRMNEVLYGASQVSEKYSLAQIKAYTTELEVEKLREQHRIVLDRLSGSTLRGAAATDVLSGSMQRTVGSTMAASSALRVMEGAMPLRAAASFLGTLQGIGPAMQLAFPLFGAIALIEVFGKISQGAAKFFKDLEEAPRRATDHFRELNGTLLLSNDELRLSNDRIGDTIAKLEHKPRNLLAEALDEARVEADKLASSLAKDIDGVEKLIKANSVGWLPRLLAGREGTGDIEKEFTGYQHRTSDINYAGQAAVHAATNPAQAKKAQDDWDMALALGRAEEQKKIRDWIAQAEAPHIAGKGTIFAQNDNPAERAGRLAVLKGIDANLMEQGDAASLRSQAAILKGQLPGAQSAAAAATKQAAAEERMAEREKRTKEELAKAYFGDEQTPERKYNTAISRINAESSDAIRKNPAMAGRINADADVQRMAAFMVKIDDSAKALKKFNDETEKALDAIDKTLNRNDWATTGTVTGGFDPSILGSGVIAPPRGYKSPAQQIKDARDNERRGLGQIGLTGKLAGASEDDISRATYTAKIQYAKDEYDAQVRASDIKNAAADKAQDRAIARADALDQQNEKIFDAQMDREHAILEMALKQKEEFQSLTVGFLDAGRSGGGAGLQKFMQGQLKKLEDTVVSNAAGIAWGDPKKGTGISGMIAKMPHAQDGIMGKILQGTILGPKPTDPLKLATDANTMATIANTTALQRAAAMSPSGGGGSAGGGSSSAASTYARIAGGYSETDTPTSGLPTDGHPGDYGGEYGPAQDPSAGGGSSSGMTVGKGIGYAAAGVGAGFAAYSAFKKGGAQGALQGVGAITGAAAMVDPEPVSKAILMGVALGASVLSAVLGDPHAIREAQIARTLQTSQYRAPVSINASMTTGGGYSDYDRFGGVRGSNLSPYPSVEQGYFDARRGVSVPGRTDSYFGGANPGGAPPPVIVQVQTLDSRSFNDNSHLVAEALQHALITGKATGLQETLRTM